MAARLILQLFVIPVVDGYSAFLLPPEYDPLLWTVFFDVIVIVATINVILVQRGRGSTGIEQGDVGIHCHPLVMLHQNK